MIGLKHDFVYLVVIKRYLELVETQHILGSKDKELLNVLIHFIDLLDLEPTDSNKCKELAHGLFILKERYERRENGTSSENNNKESIKEKA